MSPQETARRHTLLVVDDEPAVVRSVKDLFRLEYDVLGATSADEGLRLLAKNEVHIVMSDQRMPGMSGVEFLTRVRQGHPDIVRLLFTGYTDLKAVIDAINQGHVYRYIGKPWDMDELQAVMRQAAERYELLVERRRLLEEVSRKNRELETANQSLKSSLELKSVFLQVASHELRGPLTIVLGMTQLALESGTVKKPVKDWLVRTQRSGNRLAEIVDQMMKVLSAERLEAPLHAASVDLRKLLGDAADDVRPFLDLRRQKVRLDVPAEAGQIEVDAPKIRDSLNHLLLNAIKFTPDRGEIHLSAHRPSDERVEIRVRDSGVGIEANHLPHVFDPFFTTFDATHHSSGSFEFGSRGIGLGLSVVKAFVEMHGGTVAVESQVGVGSTFLITLPVRARRSP